MGADPQRSQHQDPVTSHDTAFKAYARWPDRLSQGGAHPRRGLRQENVTVSA